MNLNICITEEDKFYDHNIPLSGFSSIDSLVDDAECDEISVESLDYIPLNDIQPFLQKLVTKLRHNGRIKVRCTDLNDVGRVIQCQQLSTQEINESLFGSTIVKRSLIGLNDLCQMLESNGLKILIKRMQNTSNYVEAIRE